jgi:hypothetical protein
MKILSFGILILITGSLGIKIPIRNFITGFFTSINGVKWHLDEKCLNSDFNAYMNDISEAINEENFVKILFMADKIVEDIRNQCPVSDTIKVFDDFMSLIKGGELQELIINHSDDIIRLAKEQLSLELNPLNIGRFVGNIANIIVYNKTHNGLLIFSEKNYEDPNIYALLLDGLLEGVSNVPIEQNKCNKEVFDVKPKLIEAIKSLHDAIKYRTNIIEAIEKFVTLINELKSLDIDCRFNDLSVTLVSLTSKAGIAKLFYRITVHAIPFLEDINSMHKSYEERDYQKTGQYLGKIIKISLNYYTE